MGFMKCQMCPTSHFDIQNQQCHPKKLSYLQFPQPFPIKKQPFPEIFTIILPAFHVPLILSVYLAFVGHRLRWKKARKESNSNRLLRNNQIKALLPLGTCSLKRISCYISTVDHLFIRMFSYPIRWETMGFMKSLICSAEFCICVTFWQNQQCHPPKNNIFSTFPIKKKPFPEIFTIILPALSGKRQEKSQIQIDYSETIKWMRYVSTINHLFFYPIL